MKEKTRHDEHITTIKHRRADKEMVLTKVQKSILRHRRQLEKTERYAEAMLKRNSKNWLKLYRRCRHDAGIDPVTGRCLICGYTEQVK